MAHALEIALGLVEVFGLPYLLYGIGMVLLKRHAILKSSLAVFNKLTGME
jgi:hypothetical protein